MSHYSKGEFEIDILDLFYCLWAKKWVIILSGTALALIVVFISKFVLPVKYESSTKLYVLNWQDNSTITYNDLQTATQLAMDYKELIVSRPVTEQVIANLGLDTDDEDLAGMISVTVPEDTRIISITAEYGDPYLARDIVNQVRDAAIEHIGEVMSTSSVNVAEQANLPTSPSSPNVLFNGIIGGAVGILLSSAIILIIRLMDDTIKTPDDVERFIGATVFVCVPLDKQKQKEAKISQRLLLRQQRRYYAEN